MEVWNRSESVGAFERIGVMSRESNAEALENDSGYVLVCRKVQQEGREYANSLIFGGNWFIVSSSSLRSIFACGNGKRWRVDQPNEMN